MRHLTLALLFSLALLAPLSALAQPVASPPVEGSGVALAPVPEAPAAPVAVPIEVAPVVVPAEVPAPPVVLPPVEPVAVPAGVEPVASPSWISSLGSQILGYLLPVLAAFLSGLLAWLLSLVARKLGISLDLAKDAAVRGAIRAAIGGAEEWAARKLKLGEPVTTGADKAAWVLSAVAGQFPGLLPADLKRMLDEEIATMPKVGATGNKLSGR